MTATFGKLENQTLHLQPGLNVIQAPNEWGKSTWCAFLVNMFYGLETRAKSTKTALADKERYMPWSGSPMSGRIDLNWNGRDITIERWSKGRTPMGEFRAYETHSGVNVPELTAASCAEVLLGVERSVFMRSAFLRLADLPVTEDDALRRRLNALVTTGDESNAADVLAQKLKELKNQCRYHQSGALPAAEKKAAQLQQSLQTLHELRSAQAENEQHREQLQAQLAQLQNHKAALAFAAAQEQEKRIARAQLRQNELYEHMNALQAQCAELPGAQQCEAQAQQLRQLHAELVQLDMEQTALPPPPQMPQAPAFSVEQAAEDGRRLDQLKLRLLEAKKKMMMLFAGCVPAALAALAGALAQQWGLFALAVAGMLLLAATGCSWRKRKGNAERERQQLLSQYGCDDPQKWLLDAQAAQQQQEQYAQALERYRKAATDISGRRQKIGAEIDRLTGGKAAGECLQQWEAAQRQWERYAQARENYGQARAYAEALSAVAAPAEKPPLPDTLTCSLEQTKLQLECIGREMEQCRQQQGKIAGRMESIGREEDVQQQLQLCRERICRLEQMYAALELAQATLASATAELQRRFAPQIAQNAQQIFRELTGCRYDRLSIAQDMSLQAGALDESVVRSARWRSEGTVDQMYLALRLAVSRALSAQAPMIIDDALVRFDDVRHAAAMEILRREAQQRQILFFTCQSRANA